MYLTCFHEPYIEKSRSHTLNTLSSGPVTQNPSCDRMETHPGLLGNTCHARMLGPSASMIDNILIMCCTLQFGSLVYTGTHNSFFIMSTWQNFYCILSLLKKLSSMVQWNHTLVFNPYNSQLRVVIATIAFGMGIDCSNVRRIMHWGVSDDACRTVFARIGTWTCEWSLAGMSMSYTCIYSG